MEKTKKLGVISSFGREVGQICAVLGYYAVYSGNFYRRFGTTYRSHPQGSIINKAWKMSPIVCPEMSVRNHYKTLRNIPEERRSHRNLSVLNFENKERHKHVRVEYDVRQAKFHLRLFSINTSASQGPSPPLLFICNTDVYSSGQIKPTSGLHPTILQSDHCPLHSKAISFPSV